jgi:hypothetical protein
MRRVFGCVSQSTIIGLATTSNVADRRLNERSAAIELGRIIQEHVERDRRAVAVSLKAALCSLHSALNCQARVSHKEQVAKAEQRF